MMYFIPTPDVVVSSISEELPGVVGWVDVRFGELTVNARLIPVAHTNQVYTTVHRYIHNT